MRLTKLNWVGAMTLSSLLALPLAQAQDKKEGTAAPAAPTAPPAVGAPPSPGTPPAPRVITPEQRAACEGDAMRLCSEYQGVDQIKTCMQRKRAHVSARCRAVMTRQR